MTAVSSGLVQPAHACGTALNGGPSQRIALRRSAALYLAMVVFVVVAVAAVCATIAPHFGVGRAAVAGFAVLAVLGAVMARYARAEPRALKIGPEGLSVWNGAGILCAQARIVGCCQWSDSLLMLLLEDDAGSSYRLLITADMLGRDVFRELAVLARRGARV